MLFREEWSIPKVPTFGRRWHSFSRLDIRPVLWSLRNRPEDWKQGEHTLDHIPSKHEFWTANGFWFYALYRTADNCSCTKVRGGGFSFIQKIQFSFARRRVSALARARINCELAGINAHFSEHFLAAKSAQRGG